MFVRRKVVNGTEYYQLVEGYRDESGKVRHRNIASLGTSSTVEEAVALAQRDLKSRRRKHEKFAQKFPPGDRHPLLERFAQDVEAAGQHLQKMQEAQRRLVASKAPTRSKPRRPGTTGNRLTQQKARAALSDNPLVRAFSLLGKFTPQQLEEMMLIGRLTDTEITAIFDTATKEDRLATREEVLQRAIEKCQSEDMPRI